MATAVGNLVKETTTTTGTGTIDLDGAPTGFQSFADEFTSGVNVPYTLVDDPDNPNAWEVGLGTWTAGTPNTLSRDTVYASSDGGTKITLSGTTTVISSPLAAQTTVKDGNNDMTGANTFSGPLIAGPGTELTIASGAITPTGNYHTVDTESDATADNLDSIVVTNIPDGGYLLLRGESPTSSPARVVTIRSGISPGNITLQGGFSFVMDTAEARILLQRKGALFEEVTRSILADSSVTTAKIADNAVTGAKIAFGSDAQGDTPYYNGTDYARLPAASNTRQFMNSQGSGANPQWAHPVTPASVQSTASGTAVTFSSLPAGINRVTVLFHEVSLDATNDLLVRLGDSGGIQATGYVSTGAATGAAIASNTTGFLVRIQGAARVVSGSMKLHRITSNTWVADHDGKADTTAVISGGGSVTLSGELTQLQVLVGGGNFDGGQVNIFYE